MKEKDFWDKYGEIVNEAKKIWIDKSKKSYKKIGDVGPIIMGDGINVLLIPKRCRNPKPVEILPSADVAQCQGNAHYEQHASSIVDWLKGKGIDCWYSYGIRD